ncbi:MAG: IS1380 family transposase, partial [bacterium]
FSAFSPHLLDFLKVLGIEELFRAHVNLNKRKSPYSSSFLSKLLITQTILGYDRIETSRILDLDGIYKQKLELENYPDPETFRDELNRYNLENIDQLFIVNRKILYHLVKLEQPQYINLHFDAKVITVYGDQEEAQVGYNPDKPGRKSYLLKVCSVEPFGFVLAIRLEPGDAVSTTEFGSFYRQCMDAIPTEHFVVHTVRLDKGFFSENNIQMLEGDYPFFEIAAKQYKSLKDFIQAIPEENFDPLYPSATIEGASFSFCLDKWEKPRDFVVVRRPIKQKNGQLLLFPQDHQWHYQVICHDKPELSPREVWEDYNQRAKIEQTIKELDYNYFLTKVPTGNFLANFAHMWHCVLAHNTVLLFKRYILQGEWATRSLSTLRKKLFNIPGRLVNRSGKMIMRLIKGFKEIELLNSILERLGLFHQKLKPKAA